MVSSATWYVDSVMPVQVLRFIAEGVEAALWAGWGIGEQGGGTW